jgi:hypothetical protein
MCLGINANISSMLSRGGKSYRHIGVEDEYEYEYEYDNASNPRIVPALELVLQRLFDASSGNGFLFARRLAARTPSAVRITTAFAETAGLRT